MSRPQVSVITPTLNAAQFIAACVASVELQGEVVLEHIVVDGGSTDGTADAVRRLMQAHPRLRLISLPGGGQSDALNKGWAAARGAIIGVLNCDDFYEPGVAAKAARHLSQLGRPGLVTGDCRVIDEHGATVVWNRPHDLRLEALLLGPRYAQHPVNPSAYFYHREVHQIVGGYDTDDHLTMDLDFLLTCAAKAPMIHVAEHWGNFRLIPGCKSLEHAETGVERSSAILTRHKQWLRPRQRALMHRIRISRRLTEAKWMAGRVVRRLGSRFGLMGKRSNA